MTPRLKLIQRLLALKLDQARKQQNHIPALIQNGRVAEVAADFAGELVLDGFVGGVVPFEVVVALEEVDVCFVEDGGPLEGGGWRVLGFVWVVL